MKNIFILILISVLTFSYQNGYSQKNRINPLEKRFSKISLILKGKYPPIKKNQYEITIFSHKKCGRCRQLLKLLREKHIPIIVYDLKIPKYGNLMRRLCYKQAGKQGIGIHYPVVLENDKVIYKIRNIGKLAKDIETKYTSTKNVNKP